MTTISIFGGHGKVALLLEPLLTARGDEVSALIRNPDQADAVRATGATPIVADIEHLGTAEIAEIIRGADAVVWSAGAGGGSADRTYAVDRDAAIRSMDAAALAGVRRYVMVSYLGSGPERSGVQPDNSFYAYADAKFAADEYLRATDLDWTILGPGALTLEPGTGRIQSLESGGGSVPRADVAAVVAATLSDPGTIGRTIGFVSGDTPIADAITSATGR